VNRTLAAEGILLLVFGLWYGIRGSTSQVSAEADVIDPGGEHARYWRLRSWLLRGAGFVIALGGLALIVSSVVKPS
jgi:hypothetical protein